MTTIPRRDFLGTVAATGTGLLLGAAGEAMAQAAPAAKPVALALIGFGSQGRNLADSAAQIPGVQIRALCDIWPYRLQYGANRLKDYQQKVNVYADYRELLDKEKGLDAAIIATPDFVHAEQANACLAAGLHVYCETMMADSLDAARSMILRRQGGLAIAADRLPAAEPPRLPARCRETAGRRRVAGADRAGSDPLGHGGQ